MTDLDRLLRTATRIAVGIDLNFEMTPSIALAVKHGNVCGVGVADEPIIALQKMVLSDPTSLTGGVVFVNFEINEEAANLIRTEGTDRPRILDTVIAPSFTPGARRALDRRNEKCRMFENEALLDLVDVGLDTSQQFRQIWGDS